MSTFRYLTFGAVAVAAVAGVAGHAYAQSAAAKAAVDAAKARGVVGEQADGFLGFVAGGGDAALQAAVREINAGRAALYRQTAAETGVTAAVAGQATAEKLFARLPAGQYYRPASGGWVRK